MMMVEYIIYFTLTPVFGIARPFVLRRVNGLARLDVGAQAVFV